MIKFTLVSTVVALHFISASHLEAQANWDPYGQAQYTSKSNSSADSNAGVPNTGAENKFSQETQERYRQMNEQNQNMIERDRMMMRKGYDPNETYNYSQRKIDPQPSSTVPYPENQPGPLRTRFDNAETLIQGKDATNINQQNNGGVGANPYLNDGKNFPGSATNRDASPQSFGQ